MTTGDIDCAELDGELDDEATEPGADGPALVPAPLPPGYLSPHFRQAEFACNHCGELPPSGIPKLLVAILEEVRRWAGAPVVVTSGYRCATHNRNVGGARFSQHRLGTAADIRVVGKTPAEVHRFLSGLRGDKGGLGLYKTFVHVDIGPDGRRWKR